MLIRILAVGAITALFIARPLTAGDDPFADESISYDQGANPAGGYTDPTTSLGSPERFTGEGIFPGVVSVFSPAWGLDELVSIGAGGHLEVRFDTPVTDDPANPFGIDLLIFGNAGFIDAGGVAGAGLFGADGGLIEVSADGAQWFAIAGVQADGLFPTVGYLDAGQYDTEPGTVPSDFTLPVDPTLTTADFAGLDNAAILNLYAGSGGGAGVDIGSVGLSAVSYVRITNPGNPAETPGCEIDAFVDVAPVFAAADLDMDGMVGITDFLMLLAAWGPGPDRPLECPADLDGSGDVGIDDFLELLAAWG